MSRKLDQASTSELEKLYAEQREVEPASGLDRIIRAQAEQAIQPRTQRRPTPWIAGAATAGALVLAIGVVVNQADPPGSQPLQLEAPAPAGEEALRLRSAPLPARSAEIQADAAPAPETMMNRAFIADSESVDIPSVEQRLTVIRELLAAGDTDKARIQLQALKTEHPDVEVPEDLKRLSDDDPG